MSQRVVPQSNQINRPRRPSDDGVDVAVDLVPCERPGCVALAEGGGVCPTHRCSPPPARGRPERNMKTGLPLFDETERRALNYQLLDVLNKYGRDRVWKLLKTMATDERN